MPDIKDALGTRMKSQYEHRYRIMLPRRTYTILRLDGKSFHTFTRHCKRPYDIDLMAAFDYTAKRLCEEMAGVAFAYTQSDEISILLTDFAKPETVAWFDGNLQKLVSVAASICTAEFNCAYHDGPPDHPALFDCRAFIIPDPTEVENYFIWRQKDAERNSLSMLAQHHYSPKQLLGVPASGQHDLIHAAGDNWNNHPDGFKRGRWVIYTNTTETPVELPAWVAYPAPIFTAERERLSANVPRYT